MVLKRGSRVGFELFFFGLGVGGGFDCVGGWVCWGGGWWLVWCGGGEVWGLCLFLIVGWIEGGVGVGLLYCECCGGVLVLCEGVVLGFCFKWYV